MSFSNLEALHHLYLGIEQAPCAAFIVNHKAEILLSNKMAQNYLAFTEDELSKMTIMDFDNTHSNIELFRKPLKPLKKQEKVHLQATYKRKNKTCFQAELQISIINHYGLKVHSFA